MLTSRRSAGLTAPGSSFEWGWRLRFRGLARSQDASGALLPPPECVRSSAQPTSFIAEVQATFCLLTCVLRNSCFATSAVD